MSRINTLAALVTNLLGTNDGEIFAELMTELDRDHAESLANAVVMMTGLVRHHAYEVGRPPEEVLSEFMLKIDHLEI